MNDNAPDLFKRIYWQMFLSYIDNLGSRFPENDNQQ
mgnify:CR=1 FL=1